MLRKLGYFIAFLLVAGLVFAAGTWAGFDLRTQLEDRTSLPFRIQYKLVGYYNSLLRNNDTGTREIVTNRLTLREETVFLPLDAADYAGGISTIDGKSVLIFDRLGNFFHIDGARVAQLDLPPPENNVDDLRATAERGDLGAARVDFKWFRYNDILHLRAEGRAWLLASYTEWRPEDACFNSALARIEVDADAAAETWTLPDGGWQIVARTEPCLAPFTRGEALKALEAGGRLAAESGTSVIWTSGSYERDDRHEGTDFTTALAQDPSTDYGKVLRVDILSGAREVVARGLRNPQGLTIDADGDIWVSDHGMRGGDELNLVREGRNFGYPAVTYGTRYDRKPAANAPRHADHDGYDQPVVAFVPGIAPGSALAVEGFHYAWDGDVIVGAFDGSIYRVHVEDDRAAYVEPVRLDVRSRDMAMLAGGTIAIWTDDRRLVYLSAATGPDPVAVFEDRIAALDAAALRAPVSETFESCLQCHGLAEGDHAAGPSLHGICGRRPGGLADYDAYSGALKSIGGVWDADRLAAFIADPGAVAPGTTMAWGGLDDTAVAAALGDLLCGSDSL